MGWTEELIGIVYTVAAVLSAIALVILAQLIIIMIKEDFNHEEKTDQQKVLDQRRRVPGQHRGEHQRHRDR
jgi:hypothetical protein